jgi:ABC-type amino acid transport substrate-binding protein
VVAGVLVVVGACAVAAWKWWEPHEAAGGGLPGSVPAIAATVPGDIRNTGKLVIGVNVPYAPNEFKNSAGDIVGFDVDLMNAVARTLGLTPEYRETEFDQIIPSVQSGAVDIGMSSVTDTADRQKAVDFVTYFEAGTLWAQRAGQTVRPDAACGLRVGVAASVLQETVEIPAKSDQCVAAGLAPIEKVVYHRQDDVTAALIAGDIAAMSADSPVTGFAIKLSGGSLVPAGEVFDAAPYGWPVAKGSALAQSLMRALQHLISTGEYKTIATMWGVEKGMIPEPALNGAVS